MDNPMLTVIMVNYNSQSIWEIVSKSIKSVLSIKYRPLEVIIVDNSSTDNSYELIKKLVDDIKPTDIDVKVIRLSKNYGFSRANIIAYHLRNKNSRYVALINNDVIVNTSSVNKLIYIMEKHERIAGVQGVLLTWDGLTIDSYGCFITDHGLTYAVGNSANYVNVLKPIAATYIDGAFSIYRIEAIEKCGGLFMPYFFMWGDDYELGIRLWRCGYILVALPIVAGRHYRSATVGSHRKASPLFEYWSWVSNIAVTVLLYGNIIALLKRVPTTLLSSIIKRSIIIIKGFIDGIRLGMKIRRKLANTLLHLKNSEPRLRCSMLKELMLLTRLYLKYKMKASRIYYIIITRSLLNHYAKKL